MQQRRSTARNTLDSARIPRASKLLICGLFQEGRVLAQDGVGGAAATECRTSTEAKTSSQDLNSHGCLPVNTRFSLLRITPTLVNWRRGARKPLTGEDRESSVFDDDEMTDDEATEGRDLLEYTKRTVDRNRKRGHANYWHTGNEDQECQSSSHPRRHPKIWAGLAPAGEFCCTCPPTRSDLDQILAAAVQHRRVL